MKMMKEQRAFPLFKFRPGLLLLTLVSLTIVLLSVPALSGRVKKPISQPSLVPASILRWPGNNSPYAVLVDKSAQKIFLYHRDNLLSPSKIYPCSTGENEGPKSKQNDRKTPEGIYFFTNFYVKNNLSPIYGARAFPIDYPNPMDKKEGREGYGIWFHGTNKPLKPRDSNGCIVLDNHNIDQLADYIKLYDTPVIISSRIEMVRPEKLKKEKKELEKIIEDWRREWERKEIDRYMSFYSRRFTAQGKDWDQWKRTKSRLANQYEKIRVEINNLQLLRNDHLILARFNQRYKTEVFNSEGEKRLFLQKNSNQWKIVGEFFEGADKRHVAIERPAVPKTEEIQRFIELWRKAWERKDLKTYIACYDTQFRSRSMGLRSWKRHREGLNRKYRSLEIQISNLKVEQVSDGAASVTFKQNYRADEYNDVGLKEISLIKKGKHWKIRKEEWQPLGRNSRL